MTNLGPFVSLFLLFAACGPPAPAPARPAADVPVLPSEMAPVAAPLGKVGSALSDVAAHPSDAPKTASGLTTRVPPDVAAPPPDANSTPDGLATKVTKPGTGNRHPAPADGVRALESVWTRDGRLLRMANKPTRTGIVNAYEGWRRTLEQMVEGEVRTAWVPESLGWFHEDVTLVVELVEIIPGTATPADVGAAPRDAVVEKSGLVSKVVKPGVGTVHPTADSLVAVQFVGWTTKGTVVDSSYGHGPVELRLAGIVPRFAELLELMVEGEVRRIWTPEALIRYSVLGSGMLVYDVELVRVGPPPRP
jgi:FKBP-type peptidyl-prolyl cis-trans isomerase